MATAMRHTKGNLLANTECEEDEERYASTTSLTSIVKSGIPWTRLHVTSSKPLACGCGGIILKGRYGSIPVVLKVMRREELIMMKCLKKLLLLDHVNIMNFYGICTKDDIVEYKHATLVMEYCRNGSLSKRIKSNQMMKKKHFLKWSYQIADGMAYLHSQSIAHRNLKPQNVLLNAGKDVRIGGFTLCKEMKGANGNTFCGTALYMAPEVVAGPKYSLKVDVWSYGVVLREMLTQNHPYALRNAVSIALELGDIATEQCWPNAFSLLPPVDSPTHLQQLIYNCFAPDYEKRPSFDEILVKLKEIKEEIEKLNDDEWMSKKKGWRTMIRKGKRSSV